MQPFPLPVTSLKKESRFLSRPFLACYYLQISVPSPTTLPAAMQVANHAQRLFSTHGTQTAALHTMTSDAGQWRWSRRSFFAEPTTGTLDSPATELAVPINTV